MPIFEFLEPMNQVQTMNPLYLFFFVEPIELLKLSKAFDPVL